METILFFRKPLLLLFLCLLPSFCFSQVTEQWVKRYNGPGNGGDAATSLAVDTSGNIYVTGLSVGSGTESDYSTIKYDAAGNELWIRSYNGPANSGDVATSLAIDASGNVYVTGNSNSVNLGSNYDYATIKYDTNGNELWVRRYNGPGNSGDYANSLAVDASGNVYVTGASYGREGGSEALDYATIKYDANGNELWVRRYNGSANNDDRATSLAVDAFGNVYVTGQSSGTGPDYATIKYDANGNELWAKRYSGPGNDEDIATSLAVDASGNVYVTGGSWGIETLPDYATIKYDANGNELWVRRYNSPNNHVDFARSLVVDASGNVYVAGESIRYFDESGNPVSDYATLKYDMNGNELWVKRYNGPGNGESVANSLAVDASANVYVTGWSIGSGTYYDYATIKYDANGNELWVRRYDGPGNDADFARSLVVDSSGNVYVTGESDNGTGRDYTTIKYSQTQNNVPTVGLSIPYNIVKYSAPARIKLNATAADEDGTVTKVQFFNGTTRLHTEDVYPYGFLWIDVPVGNYTLTAKAFDNSGNVTTSNAINVSVVAENVPPVVSIVSPADDTTYTGPATIRLIADAHDANDRISKVEFYNGTTLLRTEYYYPYTYNWINVQPGTYTITAKATDGKGLSATSEPVTVTVTASNLPIVRSRPSSADNKSGMSLKLTPNPARHTLQIYTNGLQQNKQTTISVISASGAILKTIRSNTSTKVVQLDVSSLVSGVYIVKVISGDKVMYKEFVRL